MKIPRVPAAILLGLALAACAEPSATPLAPGGAEFAKPGGGGGSTETDPTATFYLAASQNGLSLWGDGLTNYVESDASSVGYGMSRYKEKECGVNSKIFATTEASNSGDAIMNTSNTKYRDRQCPDYPRTIRVSLSDRLSGGGPTDPEVRTETFMNAFNVQNTTTVIGVNETVQRPLHIRTSTACESLRFRPVLGDGTQTGADLVNVTRLDARTWRVQTQPDETIDGVLVHHDKAACIDTSGNVVGLYHLPVDFYIVASRDMPTS